VTLRSEKKIEKTKKKSKAYTAMINREKMMLKTLRRWKSIKMMMKLGYL
jgi:hypothetical protein